MNATLTGTSGRTWQAANEFVEAEHPRDGGGKFTAGNGGTDTPQFRAWFGDSKVVDADGKPLRVYHGTRSNIPAFSTIETDVFFFAPNPEHASLFAEDRKQPNGGNVVPVYLSVQKPLDARKEEGKQWFKEHFPEIKMMSDGLPHWATLSDIKDAAIESGHDGIWFSEPAFSEKPREQSIAVFSPSQIKSAFNRGTWSRTDPHISNERLGLSGCGWAPKLAANAGVACGESYISSDKECRIGEAPATWEPDNLLPLAEFEKVDSETAEHAAARKENWVQFNKARDMVRGELVETDLGNWRKRAYLDNAQHVLIMMPKRAVEAFNRNVKEIQFYNDTTELTDEVNRLDKQDRGGKTVGGAWQGNPYSPGGVLHLDGNIEDWQGSRGTYAHEFGHACDWMVVKNPFDEEDTGAGHRISWDPEWQRAHHVELKSGQLTKYATTSPTEGFAEFARLCWTGERPRTIAKEYPKCYAVFKQHGLVA